MLACIPLFGWPELTRLDGTFAINRLQMLYRTSRTLLVVCSLGQISAQQVLCSSKKMVADLLAQFLEFGFRYRELYHCRPATFCNSILPIPKLSYATCVVDWHKHEPSKVRTGTHIRADGDALQAALSTSIWCYKRDKKVVGSDFFHGCTC